MASPVVQQVVENSTATAGTSHVITLPTATAGQLLLILLDKGSTAATINAHGSLTELLDENAGNGLYIAYRQMDGTEPSSYTLTSSASTRSASLSYRISGHINPAAQAPQIGTTGTGTSATPDPPASATPGSSQDYLFIAVFGQAGEEADDDTWANTPPTNYTPSPPRQKACGIAGTNLGGLIASAERALTTGSAENPGTFGVDVSAAWRSQTIMISPATPQDVTPGNATLTTALFAPTVATTANQAVTPGILALALATFAPLVVVNTILTALTASLTLATFAPTVAMNLTVTPTTQSLALTTYAPGVGITNHQSVTPATAARTLTTYAPTVQATANQAVTPLTRTLGIETFAPTITATNHQSLTPGPASLTLTFYPPTVSAADPAAPSHDEINVIRRDGSSWHRSYCC